jgi:hypothetical protein
MSAKDGVKVSIKWNEASVRRAIDKHLDNLLKLAGEYFRTTIVMKTRARSNRDGKHSNVGEHTFAGEARLSKSYFYVVKKGRHKYVTIGTPLKYGLYHEIGAPKAGLKPRPNLQLVWKSERAKLKTILTKSLGVASNSNI